MRPSPRTLRVSLLLAAALLSGSCGDDGPTDPAPELELVEVGRGPVLDRFTSDLWVHGDAAYTGTWGGGGDRPPGNTLYVWDVSDPRAPALADSVLLDAGTVNDVKVSAAGDLGVATHEHASDDRDGITLLDLSDPLAPEVLSRFTESLEAGVHNVWIDDPWIYAAEDPGNGGRGGLRVVDVSDPERPRLAATWQAETSLLHDVYVRDGLAFLSYWDAGLVILDVGHGEGSPESPLELGRVEIPGGNAHNAWYWPETGYVFVGQEEFSSPPGILHVVDARDPASPRAVATFEVPETSDPPHNFWLDENRGVLYAAWYGAGVRAIDVNGELEGALHEEDRELASLRYGGGSGTCDRRDEDRTTCAWAPQLHRGLLFVADMELGLVVLEPAR